MIRTTDFWPSKPRSVSGAKLLFLSIMVSMTSLFTGCDSPEQASISGLTGEARNSANESFRGYPGAPVRIPSVIQGEDYFSANQISAESPYPLICNPGHSTDFFTGVDVMMALGSDGCLLTSPSAHLALDYLVDTGFRDPLNFSIISDWQASIH